MLSSQSAKKFVLRAKVVVPFSFLIFFFDFFFDCPNTEGSMLLSSQLHVKQGVNTIALVDIQTQTASLFYQSSPANGHSVAVLDLRMNIYSHHITNKHLLPRPSPYIPLRL